MSFLISHSHGGKQYYQGLALEPHILNVSVRYFRIQERYLS